MLNREIQSTNSEKFDQRVLAPTLGQALYMTHLIIMTTLRCRYYDLHLTNTEIEAHKIGRTYCKSQANRGGSTFLIQVSLNHFGYFTMFPPGVKNPPSLETAITLENELLSGHCESECH